jgi:hypothetical protein
MSPAMIRNFLFALAIASMPIASHAQPAKLIVVDGVDAGGAMTELWRAMTERFAGANAATQLRPWTETDRAWIELIRSHVASWESAIPALAAPFAPITAREQVRIVLGNQNGEDAFAHDPRTIGFDVARLQSQYGDAATPENAQRMDRFFRHEYTHLLQKAWLAAHPYEADTPLRFALVGMWTEGLGNYYSLSERWHDADGTATEMASQARAELEPRMLARLGALACAPSASTQRLTAGLSMGPFAKKWGALPVALWLDQEARRSPDALRQFIVAGPDGIWRIAAEHLRGDHQTVLREIQAAAAMCDAQ